MLCRRVPMGAPRRVFIGMARKYGGSSLLPQARIPAGRRFREQRDRTSRPCTVIRRNHRSLRRLPKSPRLRKSGLRLGRPAGQAFSLAWWRRHKRLALTRCAVPGDSGRASGRCAIPEAELSVTPCDRRALQERIQPWIRSRLSRAVRSRFSSVPPPRRGEHIS